MTITSKPEVSNTIKDHFKRNIFGQFKPKFVPSIERTPIIDRDDTFVVYLHDSKLLHLTLRNPYSEQKYVLRLNHLDYDLDNAYMQFYNYSILLANINAQIRN